MGVDDGNVVSTESVEFDVVGRDDDEDDDIACGNQSLCQLLRYNDDEVVELDRSFRFSPPPLFQHSLSSSSSSSCCSTSSSLGLLCFEARVEGEEALLFQERTDDDAGARKVTPALAPPKRRRSDDPGPDQVQKKPNSWNKGRKEKLGERVAALQQLVSPYGKTDTASVLHEAMGYIKFLHEQVQVLSTPYLQPRPRPPNNDEEEEEAREGVSSDLRSQGLCLVPVACCVHVQGSCIGADFWSPPTKG